MKGKDIFVAIIIAAIAIAILAFSVEDSRTQADYLRYAQEHRTK